MNNFGQQDTAIQKIEKKEKGKLEFSFDNGFRCQLYRTEIAQLKSEGICMDMEAILAPQQFSFLIHQIIGKRAKKRALFLLEQQDRSEKQLRDKLAKSEYPPICIDEAIAYVKKFHYLDDKRLAANFIRYSKEKMSRKQLEIKLLQKGINTSDIADAMEEEYPKEYADCMEREQIKKLLLKRRFNPESADEKEFQRTYAFLLRRGFSNGKILKEMKGIS